MLLPIAYAEWIALVVWALGWLAAALNGPFFYASLFTARDGLRLQHPAGAVQGPLPYVDVLTESVQQPDPPAPGLVRGGSCSRPARSLPGSLILAYWMGGGFLMALKRFGELRFIGDRTRGRHALPQLVRALRRAHAARQRAVLHACMASAFLATFCVRYRLELLLSLPFAVLSMALYFTTAFRDDSPVQRPEHFSASRSS